MDDRAERIHRLAVQQDVNLHQVRHLGSVLLIVEGGITLRPRLEDIEEIEDDLGQGQLVVQFNAVLGQVVQTLLDAAPHLAKLHDRSDVFSRGQDRRLHDRFMYLGDLPIGELGGVGDLMGRAVLHHHGVVHVGRGADQI